MIEKAVVQELYRYNQWANTRAFESWEYPLWRQMYHVVNHSGYHRGQLATLLRQLGARPLPTDFLLFHDQVETGVAEPRPGQSR